MDLVQFWRRSALEAKHRQALWVIWAALVMLLLTSCTNLLATPTPAPLAPRASELVLPPGFTAELVADGLSGPTQMIAGPDGRLVAHLWSTRHPPEFYRGLPVHAYREDVLDRWIAPVDAPSYRACTQRQGAW